ncbi:MAG: sugar ABC transporter substrate-binding protein [Saccharofermentanales bacterium]
MLYRRVRIISCIFLLSVTLLYSCEQNQSGDSTNNSTQSMQSNNDLTNLEESLKVDVSNFKSGDGQPLLLYTSRKEYPKRAQNVEDLPLDDAMHWYDLEYAGWNGKKTNIPKSPVNGAKGKKIIVITNGDHPYLTSYGIGAKKIADAYKMDFKLMSPNWDLNVQNQLIDQAINSKPDMIVLIPLDTKASIQQFKKINEAGIPCIASNMAPYDEGLQYVVAWTGPDDWGQFRILAADLAVKMSKRGGICYLRHSPGGSPFFSRTYGVLTELKKIAPGIKTLDMQAPGFEVEKSAQVVSDWITKYGKQLNAICIADDYAQLTGAIEACKKAGRTDIILVAAGNSKSGMDAVKSGDCYSITYQSAEADGALPIKTAADWFNGKEVEPIRYLPRNLIKKENVDLYLPAQW